MELQKTRGRNAAGFFIVFSNAVDSCQPNSNKCVMAARTPKMALLTSVAAHASLIGLLVWGASLFQEVKLGGQGNGGVVGVWLTGPSGETIGNKGKKGPVAEQKKAVPEGQNSAGEKGSGGGTGEGVGTGTGAGIGAGTGGDPRLAKIWKRVNSAKYYPAIARNQGAEGMPKVTFTIEDNGSIGSVLLAASCGKRILDDAAIETIRRAAPLPFFPGPITLTVKYSLK